jgi:hypothetical protein
VFQKYILAENISKLLYKDIVLRENDSFSGLISKTILLDVRNQMKNVFAKKTTRE